MVGFERCEWEDEEGNKCGKKIPKVPKPVREKYDGQGLCEKHRRKYIKEEYDE